ncbi:hypothetical protein [Succinispira mobilis]|uniref:hypothetical protein n=1 Tax=Succinispira mobilis TaxID=78120 RepID=UPI00037B0EDB|nr:hypothetical protein [Succinispira mobilis]
MVEYITRVIINLKELEKVHLVLSSPSKMAAEINDYAKRVANKATQIAKLIEVLGELGFILKNTGSYIYADSETIEAQVIKNLLKERGFESSEYQLYVEYRRLKGIM